MLLCFLEYLTWWRHQMETFSALLALCAGVHQSPPVEFPSQRPMTRSFDVFFDLRLNKRLSQHSRRRWFETPRRSSWRHRNWYRHICVKVDREFPHFTKHLLLQNCEVVAWTLKSPKTFFLHDPLCLNNWCGPLTRYVKLQVAHAPGMSGTLSPSPTSKETAS